ncbi:MAG: preprotein translocase subunit SecY [candidate division KSB1 bacterium]|nr:preprotein translocase subunit SecY [candidate division KSB1 bacterium]MDZ7334648.1 preprotein translocase subunit SecY [candidate division KSB1 bacterium]MDZ7357211.1 preprotein translocase subunit SecY [candidate division KSB1 bacterium]MDZ7399463.1 preprotein translocase subunit SecY [candidate division KSB1 bacterium]
MLKTVQSIFKIPDLKKRIIFTILILIVYRIGGHIPVPGINGKALFDYFSQESSIFNLYDMFAGGALLQATVFALGIMPYISSSIILQLLGAVIPYFQKLQKEGEEGRKKITQYTRYGTVLIASLQAYGLAVFLESISNPAMATPIVPNPGMMFRIFTMITMASGCVLIMWLGEQITERGIGNGISLIIFVGIVARFPNAIITELQQVFEKIRSPITEIFLWALMIATVAAVVLLTQGTRKIPVQYAKRVIGRKVYGGQSTHIPLRVNTAGVMPIIFAQSIMFIPGTIKTLFRQNEFIETLAGYFDYTSVLYWIIYGALIVFFTYFYTAIAFNPVDVADNMKKSGGFIPGVRPGKKTAEFIDNILTRITLPGSIFLALVAIFPYFITKFINVSYYFASFFGGTSLLIIVGVALDTLQQIESHLLMRHYDGFLKGGRIRGRRRF